MFRMWGKIIKNNHLLKDTVISIGDYSLSRTQMVFQALDEICYEFDLEKPIDDFLDFSEVFSTVSHRMLDKVSSIQLDKKHSAVGE